MYKSEEIDSSGPNNQRKATEDSMSDSVFGENSLRVTDVDEYEL
jgi:hypothetical protein